MTSESPETWPALQELTLNHDPITVSFEEGPEILRILRKIDALLTPETLAVIDKLVNNPAARWARRNKP